VRNTCKKKKFFFLGKVLKKDDGNQIAAKPFFNQQDKDQDGNICKVSARRRHHFILPAGIYRNKVGICPNISFCFSGGNKSLVVIIKLGYQGKKRGRESC